MLQSFLCCSKDVFAWSSSQFWTELLKLRKAGWSNKLANLMFAMSLFNAKLTWDCSQQVIKSTRLQRSPSTSNHQIDKFPRSENQVQLSSVSSDSQQIGNFPLNCFIPQLFDNFKFLAKINRKTGNSRKISQNSQTRKLEINWNSAQMWEALHWTTDSKKCDKIIGK